MPKKRPEDDVEVVASHQAFSTVGGGLHAGVRVCQPPTHARLPTLHACAQVAGWLGISPDQALQDGAPEAREEDAKRPKL